MTCSHCGCDTPRVVAYGRAVFCRPCFDGLALPPWDEAHNIRPPRGRTDRYPDRFGTEQTAGQQNGVRVMEDGNGTEELFP